jgi:modulator of FtsH protease HflK
VSAIAPQFETTHLGEKPGPQQLPPPTSRQQGHWTKGRIALGFFALWMVSGLYVVLPDQQAVEVLFGKVVAPRVLPGLHYALPWPVERVAKLKVRQLQRVSVGGDLADNVIGRSQPVLSQFLTGDQNMIHMRAVVQYSVSVPVDYLFQAQNPNQLVSAIVEAELARNLARQTVDAILTTEKVAIQNQARASAQKLLDEYHAGVTISSISIESVTPPPEAAAAFRDVASARADTARIVNDAQGYANDLIPKARGQAQQMHEESEAYKERKINEAEGDAARFNQVAAEYSKASEVTGRRLYLETMEEVLPRIKKLIVDPNGNLDLTIIRKGSPPPK